MSPMNNKLMRPRAGGGATDADARAYIAAVEIADGQKLEPAIVKAIDNFVIGCKADGVWTAIKASCILMGARTLSGALTPLAGTAPDNNGPFLTQDYDRKTGLLGNGSTKHIDTKRSNSTDPQNSKHVAVYVEVRSSIGAVYIGTNTVNASGDTYLYGDVNGVNSAKINANAGSTLSGTQLSAGFYGGSRATASAVVYRRAGANVTQNISSAAPLNENILVFGGSGLRSNRRIAFYSMGESLDLALLDAQVTALYNAIGAAI